MELPGSFRCRLIYLVSDSLPEIQIYRMVTSPGEPFLASGAPVFSDPARSLTPVSVNRNVLTWMKVHVYVWTVKSGAL